MTTGISMSSAGGPHLVQHIVLPPVRIGLHAPDVQSPFLLRGAPPLVGCEDLLPSWSLLPTVLTRARLSGVCQSAALGEAAAFEAAAAARQRSRQSHDLRAGPPVHAASDAPRRVKAPNHLGAGDRVVQEQRDDEADGRGGVENAVCYVVEAPAGRVDGAVAVGGGVLGEVVWNAQTLDRVEREFRV